MPSGFASVCHFEEKGEVSGSVKKATNILKSSYFLSFLKKNFIEKVISSFERKVTRYNIICSHLPE